MSICGAGHSGSTLVGMVLDGHPDVFYMGEGAKARYLHDERKPLRKRVCKICGEGCPVWSQFDWDRESALYPQVARHVGRRVIVDSTKNADWIRERRAESIEAGVTPVLIFLVRDGRAVINSRLRKYPDRDAEGQIRDWMEQMDRSRALFEEHDGPKRRVRYEQFAMYPKETAEALCTLAGLPFYPGMLDFESVPHHPLGGNSGTQFLAARGSLENPEKAFVSLGDRSRSYYEGHSRGIRLDLRWRTEMTPEHRALFDRIAGEMNEDIKWEA